jgi:hypothetical protein
MQPIEPFWFKQRQAKLEPAGDLMFKASAPQQGDIYLLIRGDDASRWSAAVRQSPDGADLASTSKEFPTQGEAWQAAFELYRRVALI